MNKDVVKKWIQRADYDLKTASAMFDTGRYLYVVFMIQQALEKIIKASLVSRNKQVMYKKPDKKIVSVINRYVDELRKDIPVSRVFLFGSYATGNYTVHSDIDLIIVSPVFSRGTYISNMQYLYKKAAKVDPIIEAVPASGSDLRAKSPFFKQALSNAIEIS